ncbi:hypothetical protein EA658_16550 [Pseudoxanthomonas winnipegensis]|uniref:Phage regulatory protein CII n=1 Tax=Pseudoxanthomonas winnipegensis TaxID=2480810 RepID=A0ABY1WCG8_9GAMM|nr:phage regulatory CII family protein [Pseudoxanthomonas winnipegensis]TAA11273.1 hypothetical protein EA659_07965 [Pseudoxanthomonas winnipegensis]TAA18696.1 hypothetical protein EA658_16550 [Pseudoxanthomonas winnipegensis]TAH73928.1 hypothetical protein EA657_00195 [Pseudoxanthomonas winnipegensis]
MNILDAAYKTAHEYQGGTVALATRMVRTDEFGNERAMSDAVLRNKVNPNNKTHHLSLEEASEIMGLTDNYRILHALAAEHGFTCQRNEAPEAGNLVAALLDAGEVKGKLCQLIGDALEDGKITPNEALAISAACGDLQQLTSQIAAYANAEASRRGRSAA